MVKATMNKILEIQDSIQTNSEYWQLMEEYKICGRQLLAQLETMNEDQRNAVLDYLGLGVEMHLKMLEFAVR